MIPVDDLRNWERAGVHIEHACFRTIGSDVCLGSVDGDSEHGAEMLEYAVDSGSPGMPKVDSSDGCGMSTQSSRLAISADESDKASSAALSVHGVDEDATCKLLEDSPHTVSRASEALPRWVRPRPLESVPHTLLSVFEWPLTVLKAIQSTLGLSKVASSLLVAPLRVSTHFTGIGSAELAIQMLQSQCVAALGLRFQLTCKSACELRSPCRSILRNLFPDLDVYPNIFDKLSGVEHTVSAGEVVYQALRDKIMAGHVSPDCVNVDLDISGPPCQQWSRANRARKGKHDARISVLLAWCCIVRTGRISVAILENTIGFDTSVLQDCLGDAYDMATLRVDPRHAGFAVTNRPRIYVVLVRKGRVRITHDMQQLYAEVSNIVSFNSIHNIFDVMLSSEAELVAVENATRKRLRLDKVTRRSPSWAYLLTRKQRGYLDIYTKQWKRRRGIDARSDLQCYFDLGQNPRYERGSRDRMPVFRTGCYRLWVPAQGRWLLPREVGACMGWPSFVGLPCPLLGHELPEELFRNGFLGNGMHLGNVGMVVATALSCLELEPDV